MYVGPGGKGGVGRGGKGVEGGWKGVRRAWRKIGKFKGVGVGFLREVTWDLSRTYLGFI